MCDAGTGIFLYTRARLLGGGQRRVEYIIAEKKFYLADSEVITDRPGKDDR